MVHRQLLTDAILALAQGVDSTTHRRHTLADVQVEPLDERRIYLAAAC
jgi:hypothetical protein